MILYICSRLHVTRLALHQRDKRASQTYYCTALGYQCDSRMERLTEVETAAYLLGGLSALLSIHRGVDEEEKDQRSTQDQ